MLVEVSFYISTTWRVSLLVNQRHMLSSSTVDFG